MRIRTVKLELLRPGPPHNQLLSPLTDYIALCGDAPPETVRVNFEHYRILRQLQGLRPGRSPADWDGTLTELRDEVVRLLSGIRCLATSLAQAEGDGAEAIELELVLSASELSLIPFELAFVPGSPTREIAHREVIVMRRSRRVPRARLKWQPRPRVLLVSASPPGFRPVPLQQHVQGLREALAPWLTYLDGHEDPEVNLPELKKFLVILPNASELSLQEAIRSAVYEARPFTHVHVLAHGDEIGSDDADFSEQGVMREPRFGLVFHDSTAMNARDTLSGRRFFSALAGSDERCRRQLPQVVTLASCDSGNIGGIVVPGASVAHDIHDGGVPLVVASQFPLTFSGSTVFVKRLYDRLLAGDDPRCAMRETRRSVHAGGTRQGGPADWGAIVQYGALPDDLGRHVHDAQVRALRQRADSALSSVDPQARPSPRGTLLSAWTQAGEALALLKAIDGDPLVGRYIARVHLRWAFVLMAKDGSDELRTFNEEVQKVGSMNASHALSAGQHHSLRVFRDGLRRHYRVSRNPVSLVESLLGDFFVGDEIDPLHFVTAYTEVNEYLRVAESRDLKRKLERALVDLFVIEPMIDDATAPPMKLIQERAPWIGSGWFQPLFDGQFADAPPTDYEYFAYLRQLSRLEQVTYSMGDTPSPLGFEHEVTDPREAKRYERARKVGERARAIAQFLENRGVPTYFSAIVDWIEEPDGGRRTVAL